MGLHQRGKHSVEGSAHPDNLIGFSVPGAICNAGKGIVFLQVLGIFLDIDARNAHAVCNRILLRLHIGCACISTQVTPTGSVNKTLCLKIDTAFHSALNDDTIDMAILDICVSNEGIEINGNACLLQHLCRNQLVAFHIDEGAMLVIIVANFIHKMTGRTTHGNQAVNNLLGNSLNDLLGFSAKEFSKGEETMQGRTAFQHRTAHITLCFDQHRFGTVSGSCDGRYHAGGSAACDDYIIVTHRQCFCRFHVFSHRHTPFPTRYFYHTHSLLHCAILENPLP